MATVKEITAYFDGIAPFDYAESYDNVGLLVGDGNRVVHKALVCLDVTREVAEKAAAEGCDLIISHHPLMFSPVKTICSDGGEGAVLSLLLKHDLAVLALHTNLDAAEGGVSDLLAEKLGLQLCKPLGRGPVERYVKLRVFAPLNCRMPLINAMTAAGAGAWDSPCGGVHTAWNAAAFFKKESSSPHGNGVNRRERGQEITIEVICRQRQLPRVLDAMREVHPCENPAYDVLDSAHPALALGFAKLGHLQEPFKPMDFAKKTLQLLNLKGARVHLGARQTELVAVMPGAGGEFVGDAVSAGADTVVAGELKHHEWLALMGAGCTVVEIGHHASEVPVCAMLCERMRRDFPQIQTDGLPPEIAIDYLAAQTE